MVALHLLSSIDKVIESELKENTNLSRFSDEKGILGKTQRALRAAALALWFCLRLPSCYPRVQIARTQSTLFSIYIIEIIDIGMRKG